MITQKSEKESSRSAAGPTRSKAGQSGKNGSSRAVLGKGKKGPNKRKQEKKPESEFDQKIIDLARVTRVMAGGKRMRFRACVAIGDKKGRVGVGVSKGADVTIAINKAVNKAKKTLINVPIINETIPHEIKIKKGASKLLFKPAPAGTGIKAGGIVRMILELAGIPNISSKIIGTNNKVNNAKTTMEALNSFKLPANYKQPKKYSEEKEKVNNSDNKDIKITDESKKEKKNDKTKKSADKPPKSEKTDKSK